MIEAAQYVVTSLQDAPVFARENIIVARF